MSLYGGHAPFNNSPKPTILMAVVQGSTVAYGRYADTHVAKKTEAILVQGDGGWIAGIRETIVAAVPLGNGTVHLMARTRETVQGVCTTCMRN